MLKDIQTYVNSHLFLILLQKRTLIHQSVMKTKEKTKTEQELNFVPVIPFDGLQMKKEVKVIPK